MKTKKPKNEIITFKENCRASCMVCRDILITIANYYPAMVLACVDVVRERILPACLEEMKKIKK